MIPDLDTFLIALYSTTASAGRESLTTSPISVNRFSPPAGTPPLSALTV